jgi:hypothetical protein
MLTGFAEDTFITLKRTRELHIHTLYNKFVRKRYRLTSRDMTEYSRTFMIAFERLRNAKLNAGKKVLVSAHAVGTG